MLSHLSISPSMQWTYFRHGGPGGGVRDQHAGDEALGFLREPAVAAHRAAPTSQFISVDLS